MKLSDISKIPPEIRTYKISNKLADPHRRMGIEIELENVSDKRYTSLKLWETKNDASLRNGGLEFVTPILFGEDLVMATEELEKYFNSANITPDITDRCSVHVHMDVRDYTTEQLKLLVLYYIIFEIPLFKYVGNNREHNIYCMPYTKADALVDSARFALNYFDKKQKEDAYEDLRNFPKYAALNLAPCISYGSVEFRHHPGEYKSERLLQWLNIIQKLHLAAIAASENKYDPITGVSAIGVDAFIRSVFGDELFKILSYPGIERDIYTGVRTAQPIKFFEPFDSPKEFLDEISVDSAVRLKELPIEPKIPTDNELLIALSKKIQHPKELLGLINLTAPPAKEANNIPYDILRRITNSKLNITHAVAYWIDATAASDRDFTSARGWGCISEYDPTTIIWLT